MVHVPGGTFLMGSDPTKDTNALSAEQPQHQVTLSSFWIDYTEVTNAMYAVCVSNGICTPSSRANDRNFNGNDYPVVSVSWYDANNYCQWIGGRLPTEAQWEYAARGNDGRLYPWGNDTPTCALARYNSCDGRTVPVSSFSPAGDSWVGAADMAGNIWEWAADWYDRSYYQISPANEPTGPTSDTTKVLRGGSWFNNAASLRVANRSYSDPDNRDSSIGFRCVVPLGS